MSLWSQRAAREAYVHCEKATTAGEVAAAGPTARAQTPETPWWRGPKRAPEASTDGVAVLAFEPESPGDSEPACRRRHVLACLLR